MNGLIMNRFYEIQFSNITLPYLFFHLLSCGIGSKKIKNKNDNKAKTPLNIVLSGVFVRPSGFEPETDGLENRCSIQLSYGRVPFGDAKLLKSAIFPKKMNTFFTLRY